MSSNSSRKKALYSSLELLALAAALCVLGGCVQATPRYMKASDYDRAVILYENGELVSARQKALEVPQGSPDYKASRKLAGEISAASAQFSRRHIELAEEYERAGIYGKAIDEYRLAIASTPSSSVAKNRIRLLQDALRDGRRVDIEPSAEARVKKQEREKEKENPDTEADNHYMKGKILLEVNSYAKAIEEFQAVLKYDPSYMDAKELLAKSIKERDQAVEAHLKKGMGYFQKENMEKAIKEWDIVLELDPVNKDALDYRYRAEVILDRLKKIKEKNSAERQK